jgi:hypothetical protein
LLKIAKDGEAKEGLRAKGERGVRRTALRVARAKLGTGMHEWRLAGLPRLTKEVDRESDEAEGATQAVFCGGCCRWRED